MKKVLILLFASMLAIVVGYGQATSYTDLGAQLTKSLSNDDLELFKTLLFEKDTYIQMMTENVPEGVSKKDFKRTIKNLKDNFEQEIIGTFEMVFQMAQLKVSSLEVNLKDLEFELLDPSTPMGEMTKIVHAPLSHTTFKHFYFVAMEYNGNCYLLAPMIQITEEELEL